jgi:hypothetical protein
MQTPAKTDRRNGGLSDTYAMVAVLIAATTIGMLFVLAQSHERLFYSLSNGLPPVLAFITLITATDSSNFRRSLAVQPHVRFHDVMENPDAC